MRLSPSVYKGGNCAWGTQTHVERGGGAPASATKCGLHYCDLGREGFVERKRGIKMVLPQLRDRKTPPLDCSGRVTLELTRLVTSWSQADRCCCRPFLSFPVSACQSEIHHCSDFARAGVHNEMSKEVTTTCTTTLIVIC